MPPKRENLKPAVVAEVIKTTFIKRLSDSEVGVTDKGGVLRAQDGKFLSGFEIRNSFKVALAEHGYVPGVANHLIEYYINPTLNKISELVQQKRGGKDNDEAGHDLVTTQHALVTEMRAMLAYPKNFGIDIETQNTPRHLLRIDSNELIGLLQDEDNIPDPLFVNGQLPMPKPLGDACRAVYDTLYKEEDNIFNLNDDEKEKLEQARRTRVILKEKCLNQLVREFEEAEREKDFRVKKAKVATVVARMTKFMHDILTTEGVQKYIDGIAEGILQEDAVQFPTITQRPSYNVLDTSSPVEKWRNFQNFYKSYTEEYTPEKVASLVRQFDGGGAAFFKDEAGPKDVTHLYYDLQIVFKQKGFTEEEINTTCAPFIKDMIEKMIAFKNEMNAEYKKGFGRKQSRIDELKQQLGYERKKFIDQAKNQVVNIKILRYVGVETAVDMGSVLKAEIESGTLIESVTIDFTCEDFSDIGKRLESYEAFSTALDAVSEPLRSQENANALGADDKFVKTRDSYAQKLNELKKLATDGGEDVQNKIVALASEVSSFHSSLVAFYEQYQPDILPEAETNDTI